MLIDFQNFLAHQAVNLLLAEYQTSQHRSDIFGRHAVKNVEYGQYLNQSCKKTLMLIF